MFDGHAGLSLQADDAGTGPVRRSWAALATSAFATDAMASNLLVQLGKGNSGPSFMGLLDSRLPKILGQLMGLFGSHGHCHGRASAHLRFAKAKESATLAVPHTWRTRKTCRWAEVVSRWTEMVEVYGRSPCRPCLTVRCWIHLGSTPRFQSKPPVLKPSLRLL